MANDILTQPTAYLYNGYRLPFLSFLDSYTYVVIFKTQTKYTAYCSSSPITIGTPTSSTATYSYTLVIKATRCAPSIDTRKQNEWSDSSAYTTDTTLSITASLGIPIWSSHKITYPNGNTYIAKSNPPAALYEGVTENDDVGFDLYSFIAGMNIGLFGNSALIDYVDANSCDPVAYLYNGVRLPGLPVGHQNYGEYNFISKSYFGEYILHSADFIPSLSENKNGLMDFSGYGFYSNFVLGDEGWEFLERHMVTDTVFATGTPIWTNTDLLDSSGNLYLAASEPIPVYE